MPAQPAQHDPPTSSRSPTNGPQRVRAKVVGVLRRTGILIALGWLFIGPWPAITSRVTPQVAPVTSTTPDPIESGELSIGWAQRSLDPPARTPLAGYLERWAAAAEGVHSPCIARAVTISNGRQTVTILSPDLLLITPDLADAIRHHAGLPPEQLYFAATHTHSGPGGYGSHWTDQLILGRFNPEWRTALAHTLAQVVLESRRQLQPTTLRIVQRAAPRFIRSRIEGHDEIDDRLTALIFAPPEGHDGPPAPQVILTTYAAHATAIQHDSRVLSSDYPGALTARLVEQTGASMAMFLIGPCGDATCEPPAAPGRIAMAEAMGRSLADIIVTAMGDAHSDAPDNNHPDSTAHALSVPAMREAVIAMRRLPLRLPPVQVSLGSHLRLSPILTASLADRRTTLHALRLGPIVLIGFPGDVTGELAAQLTRTAQSLGLTALATSFNGDYHGYLASSSLIQRFDHYETRLMQWHGAEVGDQLALWAADLIHQLANPPPKLPWRRQPRRMHRQPVQIDDQLHEAP